MTPAQMWLDDALIPATAIGRADALRAHLSDASPALIYGAPLTGEALALGAFQRAAYAVGPGARHGSVVRRVTGGTANHAGDGVFYLAVLLRDASVLMDCPPGRILNRNVRGLLQGLRGVGAAAHYFGRDFVSVASRPGAFVAWDEDEEGRVLFEAWIATEHSHVPDAAWSGYPPRASDPFRGKLPVTLAEVVGRSVGSAELFDHLTRGYAATYTLDLSPLSAATVAACVAEPGRPSSVDAAERSNLVWSAPYEEAIGFVCAGVRVEGDRLAEVQLRGDYYQNRSAQRAVEGALTGCGVDGTEIGYAINAVYKDRGHVIEGIAHMDSLRAVVLSAAQQATRGE